MDSIEGRKKGLCQISLFSKQTPHGEMESNFSISMERHHMGLVRNQVKHNGMNVIQLPLHFMRKISREFSTMIVAIKTNMQEMDC